MIPIYYQSSEGVIINLIQEPYMMLSDTDLLNNKWTPITAGTNNPKIAKLKKDLESPPFSIVVTGANKGEMLSNLEHIESVFDRDCFLNQMGELYIGDFCRKCFITSSVKEKVFEKTHTTVSYVATSDDAYWKNYKSATFSGIGSLAGEIAYTAIVSANIRNEYIIDEPLDNKKAHIEWSAGVFGTRQWIMFDLGRITSVDSFSGLYLTSTGSPIANAEVQTSDGTREWTNHQATAVTSYDTSMIKVDNFDTIKVASYGDSSFMEEYQIQVYFYNGGYLQGSQNITQLLNTEIDVSAYDNICFNVFGSTPEVTTYIYWQSNDMQWTTQQTISVTNDSEEVVVNNVSCRYFRIVGNYLGTINDDLSIISDEVVPNRNLLDLNYTTENISVTKNGDEITFEKTDYNKVGYVVFEDEDITLKSIVCGQYNSDGTNLYIEGYNNGEWSSILTINNDSVSESYNDDYEKIRLKFNYPQIKVDGFEINCAVDPKVYNESYAPSDAVIEIKGAWNLPSVNIGGFEYGADIELAEGHTLKIDTKNRTVEDYASDGTFENVYASHSENAFEKIETGEQEVVWGGNATEIKITLEQARSTPKWN